MALACGVMVDTILQRVRDKADTAQSRALVRRVLRDTQRLLNAKFGSLTEAITVTTLPRQVFYPLAAVTADSPSVLAVHDGARDLIPTPWTHFRYLRRDWAFAVANRHESWSLAGRDLLVLYPARPVSGTVSVVVSTLTADLTDDSVELEVNPSLYPLLEHLAEVVMLVRARAYAPIQRLMETIKAEMTAAGASGV